MSNSATLPEKWRLFEELENALSWCRKLSASPDVALPDDEDWAWDGGESLRRQDMVYLAMEPVNEILGRIVEASRTRYRQRWGGAAVPLKRKDRDG